MTSDKECYGDYGPFNDEKRKFGFKWASFDSSFTPLALQKDLYSAFQYTDSDEIKSYPYLGVYGNYLGGGYVFEIDLISNDIPSIQSKLIELEET